MKRKRDVVVFGQTYQTEVDEDEVRKQHPPKRRKIEPSLYFSDVAALCEKLSRLKGKRKEVGKQEKQRNLVDDFLKANIRHTTFDYVRLLMPKYDTERNYYKMKEARLADIYIKVLMLNERNRNRVKNYKNPNLNNPKGTNLADSIFSVLHDLSWSSSGKLTVEYINNWLNRLSTIDKKIQSQKDLLSEIVHKLNAFEHKWLVRIILRDMKMGMDTSMFGCFHPRALLHFRNTMSLKMVCDEMELCKQNEDHGFRSSRILVGRACKPMHAAKSETPFDVKVLFANHEYYVETKFDGERILIHFRRTSKSHNKAEIKYFTRNGNDMSHCYSHEFNQEVINALSGKVKTCILDGEMIVYNKELRIFENFGKNRQHGVKKDPHKNFCFKCFDVIVVNDVEYTEKTYLDRKRLLRKAIEREKENVFEFVTGDNCRRNFDLVIEKLEEEVANGNEGFVLKAADSKYVVGGRNKELWVKLKPDYLPNFEVLILGGYYGTKFERLSISHFLIGIADKGVKRLKNGRKNPNEILEPPSILENKDFIRNPKFHALVKVGSGYNKYQLNVLQERLKHHWKKYNPHQVPFFFPQNWKIPPNSEKYTPDVVIDHPKNSQVLEIKAQEVVESDRYSLDVSLRFARVDRIRDDKNWDEVCDMTEFQDIMYRAKDRIINMFNSEGGGLKGSRRRKKKKVMRKERTVLGGTFLSGDMERIEQISSVFGGKYFVIWEIDKYSCEISENDLITMIVENGGIVEKNMGLKTDYIVSNCDCNRVNNLRSVNEKNPNNAYSEIDVVRPLWIEECSKKGRFVELRPEIMIYASQKTRNFFETIIDPFKDHYVEKIDEKKFKEICKGMDISNRKSESKERAVFMIADSYDYKNKRLFMKKFVCYLDYYREVENIQTRIKNSILDVTRLSLKLGGARIVDSLFLNKEQIQPSRGNDMERERRWNKWKGNVSHITHVIIDGNDTSRVEEIRRRLTQGRLESTVKIVTCDWVEECLKNGRKVTDHLFLKGVVEG